MKTTPALHRDFIVFRLRKLPPPRFTSCDLFTLLILLALGTALVLFAGCSTPQSILKQLKDDPASARIRITGWGIVVELDRTSPRTSSIPHAVSSERIEVGEFEARTLRP